MVTPIYHTRRGSRRQSELEAVYPRSNLRKTDPAIDKTMHPGTTADYGSSSRHRSILFEIGRACRIHVPAIRRTPQPDRRCLLCPEPSSSTRRDKHEDYRYTAYETAALQIHMKHVAIVHP
jgi:hypothetical protein